MYFQLTPASDLGTGAVSHNLSMTLNWLPLTMGEGSELDSAFPSCKLKFVAKYMQTN